MDWNGIALIPVRPARAGDAEQIAEIYNQGIRGRTATFETRERTSADIMEWIRSSYPVVVAESGEGICGFAASFSYSGRDCYSGVCEFSVYVREDMRGIGAGRAAMLSLIEACASAGMWKLVSRVFPENTASRSLLKSLGFREVGTYLRHARLDGVWKDTVIVEYSIQQD